VAPMGAYGTGLYGYRPMQRALPNVRPATVTTVTNARVRRAMKRAGVAPGAKRAPRAAASAARPKRRSTQARRRRKTSRKPRYKQ
jgi:hypothetical protein